MVVRMEEADQREVSVGYCAHRDSPSFFFLLAFLSSFDSFFFTVAEEQKMLSSEWWLLWIGQSVLATNNLA